MIALKFRIFESKTKTILINKMHWALFERNSSAIGKKWIMAFWLHVDVVLITSITINIFQCMTHCTVHRPSFRWAVGPSVGQFDGC